MVTFAQAQERAEEWINGDVPSYQHREVRVREFDLGFVVWAEDRADGPRSDGGGQRLVIARDSGEASLWPSLPVGEVIRRYEEEYGRVDAVADAVPAPAARVDLNQTSFLLSPVVVRLPGPGAGSRFPRRRPGCPEGTAGRVRLCRVRLCRMRLCRVCRSRRGCPRGRRPGPGPIPTRTPVRTVPCRCPRPCSRRR